MKKIRYSITLLLFLPLLVRAQLAETEMDKGVHAYAERAYSEAMEWFKKAAAMGNPDAAYDIGLLYEHGFEVSKNIVLAVNWYEQAGNKGQLSAMKQLSGIWYTGDAGVAKDLKKAFYWHKRLALLGDTLSIYNVGVMYLNEEGSDAVHTLQALDSAARWFRIGTDAGSEQCKSGLYYTGIGLFDEGLYACQRNDFATALQLYGKAAMLGNAEAMTNLGEMYYTGKGTQPDVQAASFWLEKAAALGFALAKKNLAELNNASRQTLTVQVKLPDGSYAARKWDSNLNGSARYVYPNGDSYEGMFQHGDFEGYGTFKWAGGRMYAGTFSKNGRSGKGKQFYEDGTLEYEGEWQQDAMNGTGIYSYPGGGYKYAGTFKNNHKDGRGKATASGNIYEGEWKDDQKHGYGKTTWSNGDVYEGIYHKGVLEGPGTVIYADGTRQTGNFEDGSPSGKWIYIAADGSSQDRYYKSPGMYSVYVVTASAVQSNAHEEYNAWWEKTYGRGGSQSTVNMENIRRQQEQQTFEQRRQSERDESQRRIAERDRYWERSTDSYNRKYGRY